MNDKILKIANELVIACNRAYNRKIQTGSGGNVSARLPGEDLMLVKASGGSMGDCTNTSFLITDFDGKLVAGEGKPTREALLHGYIYKICPDVNAVVHCHSPYSIVWSSTKKALPCVTWHSKLKMAEELPTLDVPAAMVREQELPLVKEIFDKNPKLPGFLLADHGAVALGKNAVDAEHYAELIEETAQVAVLEKLLGTLPL